MIEKLDYIAGILDAEGSVRIIKRKDWYGVEIIISNTNLDIINFVTNVYPKSSVLKHKRFNRKLEYYISFGKNVIIESTFLNDMLSRCNEKYYQLLKVKEILEELDLEKKYEIYKEYIFYKKYFMHDLVNIPTDAYLAGIMDGDGWFRIHSAKGFTKSAILQLSVGLEQRYKAMVDYISLIDNSKIYNKHVKSINHTQTYSTQIQNINCENFLRKLVPFLIEKKDRVDVILKYIENYKKFKKISKMTLEAYDREKIKYLNKKEI